MPEQEMWDWWFEWRTRARVTAPNEDAARKMLKELYPDSHFEGPPGIFDTVPVGATPDDLSAPVPAVSPEEVTHA